MNIRDLINRIRTSLGLRHETPDEAVLGFLRLLEEVRVEELSCDEIYNKLDLYVEREVDQKDAAKLMPLIREHLDVCPECCEEYETLLYVIEATEKK
jgi:histidyl-tRNA synthetase